MINSTKRRGSLLANAPSICRIISQRHNVFLLVQRVFVLIEIADGSDLAVSWGLCLPSCPYVEPEVVCSLSADEVNGNDDGSSLLSFPPLVYSDYDYDVDYNQQSSSPLRNYMSTLNEPADVLMEVRFIFLVHNVH